MKDRAWEGYELAKSDMKPIFNFIGRILNGELVLSGEVDLIELEKYMDKFCKNWKD